MYQRQMIHALWLFPLLAIGLAGCSSTRHEVRAESDRTGTELQKTVVTLKPGKVYEVAFASIKKGKMKILNNEYFPKAMPIVKEYGGKSLGMFNVVAKTGGKMRTPQLVGLFEWPSLEAMNRLHADPRMKPLGEIRNDSMSFFRQAFYEVKKETLIVFRSDKTYEFFTAWLNPNSGRILKEYFKVSEPMKQRHGPPIFKANLSPLKGVPNKKHVLEPHLGGIVEWPDTQTYYDLAADEEFATKAAPLLERAVARLDMIHGKFMFKK